MGEKLSDLSAIRTDRIALTVPDRNRRQRQRKEKFESHLNRDAETEAPPAKDETSESQADTPPPTSSPRGRVMDFTA